MYGCVLSTELVGPEGKPRVLFIYQAIEEARRRDLTAPGQLSRLHAIHLPLSTSLTYSIITAPCLVHNAQVRGVCLGDIATSHRPG